MKNYCGTCGSKINQETGLCPNCDKQQETSKKEKKSGKKKKVLIVVLLFSFVFFIGIGIVGMLAYFEKITIPVLSDLIKEKKGQEEIIGEESIVINEFKQANDECIVVEEKSIEMKNEQEGTAVVLINIPDYEMLYKSALQSEDPDEFLLNALRKKEYTTIEYEREIPITVENGKREMNSEEIVKQIVEEALLNAINTLMEETTNEENN